MYKKHFISLFLAVCFSFEAGFAQPSFSAKTDFATGSTPTSVSIGDFNGDGMNDMAVTNYYSHTVSVYINMTSPGAVVPLFSARTNFNTGSGPNCVSIGDFNGDGKNDMAVVNYGSNTVSVSLNTTAPGSVTPSFSDTTNFKTGTYPYSVSIGDFNGDGKNDMAVANSGSDNVSVFLNTTAPGATTPSFSDKTDYTTGIGPWSISIGDFNGDGKNDMAVVNRDSYSVSVFLNTTAPGAATPTFSTKKDFSTGDLPASISIGDFNGDGKNDMAVSNLSSTSVSVFLNTTAPGAATPSFSAKKDFTTGTYPYSVSIEDFNGDGKNDMAVANYNSNTVSVLLNTAAPGAAIPTFSAKTDFTTGTYPYLVSTGDFNGDGKNDMAVVNYGADSLSVLLNTTIMGVATPSFSVKTDSTTGTNPTSVSIGDFNGDGKKDMAVANYTSNTVSVLLNTTSPGSATSSFSAKTDFITGANPFSVAIEDFNRDGMKDMAVANEISGTVSVFLNTATPGAATPSFSAKTDFTTVTNPFSVSMGDFNGDGRIDIAVVNSIPSGTVSVFLNTTTPGATTPSFSAKTDFTTGTNPYSVSIGDFNGDGMNDMVVANYGSASVSVLLNTTTPGATTPSFSTKTDFTTGNNPQSVSIEDFNGDGKNDIVTANFYSHTVSVLLNTTASGATTPSFYAKADFATGTSPTTVSTGDFNGDGKNDLAVTNYNSNTVSVFLNTTVPGATTPSFSAKTDFTTGTTPFSVAMADFNGDGKNDLAVVNYSSNTVSVLLNNAAFPTSVEQTSFTTQVPKTFELAQNYPNPFNPTTVIEYEIPGIGSQYHVSLRVFDLLGREVATLVNEKKSSGKYDVPWNASGLSSGVYFYRLQAGENVQVKKLMLLK